MKDDPTNDGTTSVMPILLNGPTGTELIHRGFAPDPANWTAAAAESHPDLLADIHREYARAGADVHTACTFRTQPGAIDRWDRLARTAVAIARGAALPGQRIAGSIAPLADCYDPCASPARRGEAASAARRFGELARVLADAGCDLLILETFPCIAEAVIALTAAEAAGLPRWVSFTAGPRGDLMTPDEMAAGARAAVGAGAAAVLVNCVDAAKTLPFVEALAAAARPPAGCAVGAFANAGERAAGIGWDTPDEGAPERYAAIAITWLDAGATIVGGCCGTGPAHTTALRARIDGR